VQISPAGIALIKASEGFSAHVYDDAVGLPTIGFGHRLLQGESFPDGITETQAETLLMGDLALPELVLARLVPPDCTQGQWDALCSFAMNLGVSALKTMLSHGWSQVPVQILRWNHAGGKVLPGLTARREAEAAMFTT
jgi:lysozyme